MVFHRSFKVIVSVVLAFVFLFLTAQNYLVGRDRAAGSFFQHGQDKTNARFHFLIVATGSDPNLCRLLLSASVLAYPQPTLIDWAGEGIYNATETHLAKIDGALRYLESFSKSHDHDIVLMVDGYDVLLQLGPDVLLRRYFETVATASHRTTGHFGASHVLEHDIRNTVFFGPDKTCWPEDAQRAACWAVPSSPLAPYAFGPYTDYQDDMPHARPRWLNSGTIMGPIGALRTMLQATKTLVNQTFDPEYDLRNSDQMYIANLWGAQEYARTISQAQSGSTQNFAPDYVLEENVPDIKDVRKSEFHIGIDYESALFQTFAGYSNYLAWISFNSPISTASNQKTLEPWRLDLQADILGSRKPFAAIAGNSSLATTTWRDVSLGMNIATGWIPPILHFTGDKSRRDETWTKMWYYEKAETLLRASLAHSNNTIGGEKNNIGGQVSTWHGNDPSVRVGAGNDRSWSAWADSDNEMLSWNRLCKEHEHTLFSGVSLESTK